jgi:hypothetical protein
MAINSDWKRSRTGARKIDASKHRTDEVLVDAMNQAFDLSTSEVDGDFAGEGPMPVVPHRTLAAVGMMLEQSALRSPSTKIWFYSSRCLVLDMEWSDQKIAIDMVLTDDDIIVKLHARAPDGQELLKRIVAQTGCVLRSGKYMIARVPLSAESSATGSALLRVVSDLHARGQEPIPNL